VAPVFAANFVRRIASAVEFDPVPAITWIRPEAASTTAAITRSCSSCESVGDSPVVPTGQTVGVPWAMCHSTSFRSAGSSTEPSRNGVIKATLQPANIEPFVAMPPLGGIGSEKKVPAKRPGDSPDLRLADS